MLWKNEILKILCVNRDKGKWIWDAMPPIFENMPPVCRAGEGMRSRYEPQKAECMRAFLYVRAYMRMCMYIQTYIYIGRSVYTIHYRGGRGGEILPAEAVCLARWCAVPVWICEAVCVPFLCPMVGVLMA